MRINGSFNPAWLDNRQFAVGHRLAQPNMTVKVFIPLFAFEHVGQQRRIGKMRVDVVVGLQDNAVFGRVDDKPLIGIVQNVFRVEAHPDFGVFVATDGGNQHVPRVFGNRLGLFHPADAHALNRLDFGDVVLHAVKHELGTRALVADGRFQDFKLLRVAQPFDGFGEQLVHRIVQRALKLTGAQNHRADAPRHLHRQLGEKIRLAAAPPAPQHLVAGFLDQRFEIRVSHMRKGRLKSFQTASFQNHCQNIGQTPNYQRGKPDRISQPHKPFCRCRPCYQFQHFTPRFQYVKIKQ